MSEAEFNDNQRSKRVRRRRPNEISDLEWKVQKELLKSRFLVSAKLTEVNWMAFRAWCVANGFKTNQAVNRLIATHPEIQKHV